MRQIAGYLENLWESKRLDIAVPSFGTLSDLFACLSVETKRSLIETQFSRIKRYIGSSLLTQKDNSKKAEGIIIGNIINFWNSLGKPVTVKIG